MVAGLGATHDPVPLHVLARVRVLPLHDWAWHWVPEAHSRQAPDPLQVPSRPQVLVACWAQLLRGSCPAVTFLQAPDPLHTRHRPHSDSGSVLFGWLVQVPTEPERLQARHAPVQALLQQ